MKIQYIYNSSVLYTKEDKMNKAIIVLLDKAHLMAYRYTKTELDGEKYDLIKSVENKEAMARFSEKISDQAGRFHVGGGEDHNMKLEEDKRLVKQIVMGVNELVKDCSYEPWYLASDKSIHHSVLTHLKPEVKECLKKDIAANLIKIQKHQILDRFRL